MTSTCEHTTHPPVTRELTDADINWSLPPAPDESEDDTSADMLTSAALQVESYRMLAQESLHARRAQHLDHQRLSEQYTLLLDEYRTVRAEYRALRAAQVIS